MSVDIGEKKNITEFFTIGEEIGKGSFSVVKLGKRKSDGKEFAIKCIEKKHVQMDVLKREIDIMKKVKHKNILPLHDVYENSTYIFLVLELITGGELFDSIVEKGHYSEKDACTIIRSILEAVQYLHSLGVVHRDLKPENLLCASDFEETLHVYVADFGLSRSLEEGQEMSTYCGSPEYVAPEILACAPYEKAVDLWSIGVITYILLTGFLPFYDKNHVVLFEKIQNVNYNWNDCPEVSEMSKNFVGGLLIKDPKKRMTAEQALNHPWVKGEGVSEVQKPIQTTMKEYNQTRKSKNCVLI